MKSPVAWPLGYTTRITWAKRRKMANFPTILPRLRSPVIQRTFHTKTATSLVGRVFFYSFQETRRLVFLHPPPPSIALPAAGGSRAQPTTISLRFLLHPRRGYRGLRRSPGSHDVSRPTDSFPELGARDLLGRAHGPNRVRLYLAWLSGAPDDDAVFRPHLHSDAPAFSNNSS